MKFQVIRYGFPWRTLTMMFFLYCCMQMMLFWAARKFGWWTLSSYYKARDYESDPGRRIFGCLMLGGLQFEGETAKVYQTGHSIAIIGSNAGLALDFLYLPDLEIPNLHIHLDKTKGAWIDCGDEEKVYIEVGENQDLGLNQFIKN